MKKEDLIELKKQIVSLSDEEKKQRDLYLRELANGTLQGPPTGYASIDKPWLKYYKEEDLLADIPMCKAYDYFLTNNVNNRESIAIKFLGTKISYGKLINKIDETTKALYEMGVREGDIVTMILPLCPETVYLFYAINRLGAICNSINPLGSYEDLKEEINLTKSKYIFAIEMCEEKINKINCENVIYINPLNSAPSILREAYSLKAKQRHNNEWKRFINKGKNVSENIDSNYKKNSVLAIVHTGGTTGKPKGVQLTNENFVAMAAMYKNGGLNFEKGESFLSFLPPFIAWCLSNGINMPLSLGAEITMVPTFDVQDFPKLMDRYKPNHVLGGPILWDALINNGITNLSYLKSPVSGGDSMPIELERRINDYFEKCGCENKIAQGYGMTEVSSSATFSVHNAYEEGTVGIPNSKNNISAFDDDGCEKQIGEIGEIWISTPTIMKGYYGNNLETNLVIVEDENGVKWAKTADLGLITSSGHIKIIGRKKRMIVRSGQKIFPLNDENIIMQNKNIDMCSYVAAYDEKERHVPVLHIVLSKECDCSLDEIVLQIKKSITEQLPIYDIPKYFVFRDDLPKTDINKIDVKKLEEEETPTCEISDKRLQLKRNI